MLVLTNDNNEAVAAALKDAIALHGQSDYEAAIRILRPLAEQGNARAQGILGVMYGVGQADADETDLACSRGSGLADRFVDFHDCPTRTDQEVLAGKGEFHAIGAAVEQGDADLIFQIPDAAADR